MEADHMTIVSNSHIAPYSRKQKVCHLQQAFEIVLYLPT